MAPYWSIALTWFLVGVFCCGVPLGVFMMALMAMAGSSTD